MKRLVRDVLAHYGWSRRPLHAYPQRHRHALALLKNEGCRPATVIDIGVGKKGTPWLYDAFPDAHLVLIDPRLESARPTLDPSRKADMMPVAVGAASGQLTLHIDTAAGSSSSLLEVSPQLAAARAAKGDVRQFTKQIVPVRRLDELITADHKAPYLVKIDTEGYERDVLLGAEAMLTRTEVVIAETNVAKRFEGSYEFADLVALLDRSGFRLFDFVELRPLGADGPLNYVDAVFVRR